MGNACPSQFLQVFHKIHCVYMHAGTGAWDRNAEEMEFMYMDSFKSPSGAGEESFEMLGLYAKKMRYSITK